MTRAAAVSTERLERALVAAAYIVARHGEVYRPIFEALERSTRARGSVVIADRALRLAAGDYTDAGGMRAIR